MPFTWWKPKKKVILKPQTVREKPQAALQYCKHATEFTTKNGGKLWKYILIPHNSVMVNMSFETLVRSYEYQNS